jgi:predicted dehydrogenase
MDPLRLAIIGTGGFAAEHQRAALQLEEQGLLRLVATCDPNPAAFQGEAAAWRLHDRSVQVFDDYRCMLEQCRGRVDLVAVPTPITLHAEMHQAGVEAGLAVYLEKPPTLDAVEFEQMCTTERRAARATLVGMNFMLEPERQRLKERLVAGEFGRLQQVCFLGLWPRSDRYFRRNDWAARLMIGRRLVLDSCFGNAMAHFVHALFSWAGADRPEARAGLLRARARLDRAHDIDGADTFRVEAVTTAGTTMRFAQTHATRAASRQLETLCCERATIRYEVGRQAEVVWHDGRREQTALHYPDVVYDNYVAYCGYLRGERGRPATTIEDCRGFVQLNALAYISSGQIFNLAPRRVERHRQSDGEELLSVAGLDDELSAFAEQGQAPQLAGLPWVDAQQLGKLRPVVEHMHQQRCGPR